MIIKALIAHCRLYELKCLSYIDDDLGGDWPYEQEVRMLQLVQKVFVSAGFILNMLKSRFDPGPERERIGYLINCSGLWVEGNVGYLAPTEKRLTAMSVTYTANIPVRAKRT